MILKVNTKEYCMPRILAAAAIVFGICLFVLASGFSQEPPHYTELSFPELANWPQVEPDIFSLSNEAQLMVIEDHELPLVQITILVRTGEILVPRGKEGLAPIVGEALRSGGSTRYGPDALNAILENKAADLSISGDLESMTVGLNLLRQDLEELLPVLADLLINPEFPEDKIALAKKQVLTQIARRNDNQQQVAFREFKRLVYGPQSMYGRLPEVETVQGIERSDVLSFYRQGFAGTNMLIGVVGDVQPNEVKKIMDRTLGKVPAGEATSLEFSPVKTCKDMSQRFIHMPGVNQVSILMGHVGGLRMDEDYAALQVMNFILSQGFSSRLFQNLRTQKGLAYSVYGRYGSNVFYPGIFLAGLKTQSKNMVQAVQALKDEIVALHDHGVSKDEIQRAKEEFLNSLVFRYETPGEILDRQLYYAYRDMPLSSFETLVQEIKKVTAEDVSRAAGEHLHPDRLQMLLVGNKDLVQDQLAKFPDMEMVELGM
jgi:predicted Zn-dependent peptidase